MKLALISILLWLSAADHDVKMARFRIEEQGSKYQISVSLDRVDILEAIYATPTAQGEIIDQIGDYVKSKVSYRFDGEVVPYHFQSIEYTKENILLQGTLEVPKQEVQQIEVENTCLLDRIDGHLNIMEFFIQNDKRYFRLHEGRKKTIFTYTIQPG